MNVALYGPTKRWAMTERPRQDVRRTPTVLNIGPSSVSWDGESVTFQIDEICVPLPTRIRGRVRVFPSAIGDVATKLHPAGLHWWLPIAPEARVEVEFESPADTWTGEGYLDCNFGHQPLEDAFKQWTWSRGRTEDGTVVFYDVETREGERISLARLYTSTVHPQDFPAPSTARLPTTLWRIGRQTRCDRGTEPRIIKTLEDTPFYARSLLQTTIARTSVSMVHESLSLDRFANPVVRAMLPFRMPRRRHSK
jgi:carotenoid 1,2-hydratase